jgi:transposase-like protein
MESSFNLANESRLPRWITLPPGLSRTDVSVTLDFYILPLGPDAIFILKDRNGKKLAKINGKVKNHYPLYLKSCPQRFDPGCPAYEVVVVNGITEIIRPSLLYS